MRYVFALIVFLTCFNQSLAAISGEQAQNYLLHLSYLNKSELSVEVLNKASKMSLTCGSDYLFDLKNRLFNDKYTDGSFKLSKRCTDLTQYSSLAKNELIRQFKSSSSSAPGTLYYTTSINYHGRIATDGIIKVGDQNCLSHNKYNFNQWLIRQTWPPNAALINPKQPESSCQITNNFQGLTQADCLPWESSSYSFKNNVLKLVSADPIVNLHDGTYLRSKWNLYIQPGSKYSILELASTVGTLADEDKISSCAIRSNVEVTATQVQFY